ncbi:endo-beta-N-acetylglucosaminidase H [Microbacterium sp. SD291]|uniref:endo-beta-N-acetylglucosaminidase H n=1 Tax=Microbacterium sp. SD291 TaxID=2782007 RepID=UPI001A95ADE0|nr:endo-beta-N-acetylglucosaminidase H [Microbacterium sp. SD291]MBO0982086.1 chitinase [Microbacterium sp. SD291]
MIDSTKKRRDRRRARLTAAAAACLAIAGLTVPAGASADAGSITPDDDAKRVVYVEVNSNDMANVADYTLEGTQRPAFDIAVIFAANINYDTATQSAYLHLNERVTETLQDAENQIRPLQERGTKVLLSILGNHQGAGIANFPTREAAGAFADELAAVVEQYGLDGIDFDDEWSKYGTNGTGPANEYSFVYLVEELRERLGDDKLLTFYKIGEAAETTEYDGVRAGDLLDYAWNPWYGYWWVPETVGMDAAQLAPGAINLTATGQSTAAAFAQRTADEGYGAIVTYNLTAGDHSGYLSSITEPLTGLKTSYRAPWYDVDVEAVATCAGGDVKVKVTVVNDDDAAVDAEVMSSIGTRTLTGIAPGDSGTAVHQAKRGATADGSVRVDLTGPDGQSSIDASYEAPACG